MHVLLIHQYYLEKNDGGGSRWNEMTRMWAQQGHRVTVLAGMSHYNTGKKADRYKGRYVFDDKQFEPGIRVIRSHVSEAYNVNFLGRLWGYISFVLSSLYTGIFYAKEKYDVIVVTSPPLFVGITAYVLSLIKRKPFVFEVRDLWPESAIDTGVLTNKTIIRLAYAFEAFMYRKARLVNVLTPAFRDTLIQQKKVDPRKIIFIPNAADFSLAEALTADFDPKEFRRIHNMGDQFVLTYVGAHGVANHLVQVVDAAERMKDKPVLFLLIGEGMQKPLLKADAAKRGLTNIRFIDAVPKKEVFKYILASDAGMSVLKKVDTFKTVYSNKTFDYMSCRKPIMMLIDGVSRALVEEAKAGVYIEPENIDEFCMAIQTYLNDKDMIRVHGENGYHYAKTYFDREVLASRYLEHLSGTV